MGLTILSAVEALPVTDGTGAVFSRTVSGLVGDCYGVRFLAKSNLTFYNVTKVSECTAPVAYLFNDSVGNNINPLVSVSFVGNVASFNRMLANNTYYQLVVCNGTSNYTTRDSGVTPAVPSYPQNKVNVNYVMRSRVMMNNMSGNGNVSQDSYNWENIESMTTDVYSYPVANASVFVANSSYPDRLSCNVSGYSDSYGGSEVVANRSFLWFRNGVVLNVTGMNLSAFANLSNRDNVTCGVSVFDGVSQSPFYTSSSFLWNDSGFVLPVSFVSSKRAGESFVVEVLVNSSTFSNLSYSFNFSGLNSSVFNFSNGVFNVVNFGGLNVSFSSFLNASNSSVFGNLSIVRLVDGNVNVIPLSLGISSVVGLPVVVNLSDWGLVTYDTVSNSRVFEVLNNGSYDLSGCNVSFSGTLFGQGFVSFNDSNFGLGVNQSKNLSVVMSSVPVGFYSGYLDVLCLATPGGSFNGLVVKPFVQVVSVTTPVSGGGGGGGGGGSPIATPVGNGSVFRFESLSGGKRVDLLVYPGQKRIVSLLVTNLQGSDLSVLVSCSGGLCKYLTVTPSTFTVGGLGSEEVVVEVSVPDAFVGGEGVVLSAVGGGARQDVSVSLGLNSLSFYVGKFSPVVSRGEPGYLMSVGGVNIPKLVVFLVLPVLVFVLLVLFARGLPFVVDFGVAVVLFGGLVYLL